MDFSQAEVAKFCERLISDAAEQRQSTVRDLTKTLASKADADRETSAQALRTGLEAATRQHQAQCEELQRELAAERRKGAVAPAEDDGDEEEAAGATAKGWSRVGQQPGGGGKKKSRWGRRRPSLEPIAGSSDDDVERGQPRRGRRGAPAGSSAGLMDSDDDDSPNRSKPARGGRAKPKRGGARMSEEERCRRLGTPSPDLE